MTFQDDEIAFSGSRELIERELSRSVAQVLHLMPGTATDNRSLQEVGVDLVLSVAFLRAKTGAESYFAADLAAACAQEPTPPPIPAGIVDEVKAILRAAS
jgi:hypothetical protein